MEIFSSEKCMGERYGGGEGVGGAGGRDMEGGGGRTGGGGRRRGEDHSIIMYVRIETNTIFNLGKT